MKYFRLFAIRALIVVLLFLIVSCSPLSNGDDGNDGNNGNNDRVPELRYSAVIKDGDTGGVDGLEGAWGIAVSPDGKNIYVTGYTDDAVAVFNRNTTTGALTYSTVIKDNGKGGTADGLDGANGIAVSSDGKQVYVTGSDENEVTGSDENEVAVFNRDTSTGALTYSAVISDGVGGVDGLAGAYYITASSDGKQVYVTGYRDNAVAVFNRNTTTRALSYSAVIKDGVGGVDGLAGAAGIVLSPDEKQVYVTGYRDNAVAVFNRNTTTGALTYSTVFKDGIGGVDGLDGANGIAVSPDGKQVYVTGYDDDAVAVFNRNTTTAGSLSYSTVFKNGATIGAV